MDVIGADEVGTGALAGPFIICATFFPDTIPTWAKGLNDSKQVSPSKREMLSMALRLHQVPYIFGYGWHQDIDRDGFQKTLVAVYHHVLEQAVRWAPQARVVVDGALGLGAGIECIPKADCKVPAVMAASILAKVTRDRLMREEVHPEHPQYGFGRHVGYATPQHMEALRRYGPCDAHRQSNKLVRDIQKRNAC